MLGKRTWHNVRRINREGKSLVVLGSHLRKRVTDQGRRCETLMYGTTRQAWARTERAYRGVAGMAFSRRRARALRRSVRTKCSSPTDLLAWRVPVCHIRTAFRAGKTLRKLNARGVASQLYSDMFCDPFGPPKQAFMISHCCWALAYLCFALIRGGREWVRKRSSSPARIGITRAYGVAKQHMGAIFEYEAYSEFAMAGWPKET